MGDRFIGGNISVLSVWDINLWIDFQALPCTQWIQSDARCGYTLKVTVYPGAKQTMLSPKLFVDLIDLFQYYILILQGTQTGRFDNKLCHRT